jgi:hypothetical protein
MSKRRPNGQPCLFEMDNPTPTTGAYGKGLDRPLPPRTEPVKRCFWPGCQEVRPARMLGCSPHWFRLPDTLRTRIWRHYRPGQESDGNASAEYQAALEAVVRWVKENAGEDGRS